MASKTTLAENTTDPRVQQVFDDWRRIGSLERLDPVPAALAACAVTQRQISDLHAAMDAQQEAASDPRNGRVRTQARQGLTKTRLLLDEAIAADADARQALQRARAEAYTRVAPIIEAAHAARLPELEHALRQALTAAQAVLEIETAAGMFSLPHAGGVAPARWPVPRVAEFVTVELTRCLDTLDRIRPRTSAA